MLLIQLLQRFSGLEQTGRGCYCIADGQVVAQLKNLGSRHVRNKTVQTVNAISSSAHISLIFTKQLLMNEQIIMMLIRLFQACAAFFRADMYSKYFIDQQLSARQSSYIRDACRYQIQ